MRKEYLAYTSKSEQMHETKVIDISRTTVQPVRGSGAQRSWGPIAENVN